MPKERLDSWKAIAEYLERSLRTVQRWHAHHGLPVHRFGGVKGAVFAYPEEIDNWLVSLAQETRMQTESEELALEASKTASSDLTRTANQMWESRSERNIQTVAALYRKAVDHDPANVEALTGMANSLIFAALYGIMDGVVAYPSAQDAIRRAGEGKAATAAHNCALAWLKLLYDREWRQARSGFETALVAAPNYSFALAGLALLQLAEGDTDEACSTAWKAWRSQPSAVSLGSLLCWVHALAGDVRQSLDLIEQIKLSGGAYAMTAAAEPSTT